MVTRLAGRHDIAGILALQGRNLFESLSTAEKESGFVTTPFTSSQLEELLAGRGLFVAEDKGAVLGYTMASGWDYFSQWPIFPFMISRLSGFSFQGIRISDRSSFQYGPICIDAGLRGSDAFPRLFDEMRKELSSRFPVGITFINKVNERSYRAHTAKLGMIVIDEFEFSGRQYYGLAFDTARSVILRIE
jgi:hypothetical protein